MVPLTRGAEAVVGTLCEGLADPDVFGGTGQHSKAYAAFCILSNLFHGFQVPHPSRPATTGMSGWDERKEKVTLQTVNPRLQYRIYTAMLGVAGRGDFMGEVPTDLDTVKGWFAAWGLSVDERRTVLRLIHQGVAGKEGKVEQSAADMSTLLSTYTAADAGEAVADARSCVVAAITDPATFLYDDLLSLDPVKGLAKSDPKLFQLLTILSQGSLKEYLAFHAKEAAFVKVQRLSPSPSPPSSFYQARGLAEPGADGGGDDDEDADPDADEPGGGEERDRVRGARRRPLHAR